ncbi:hypothetical protein [Thermococcus sp.]|uniref:hypothetical protein n=1 Tax=Thermococcus sp. TaxID=35749 RepID=UPI002602A298|nr:hypothetical protein [Thermococcus sp.]
MNRFPFTMPRGRRQEAYLLTMGIVVSAFLLLSLLVPPYHLREVATLGPGGYRVYELRGTQWGMVHFSIESSGPVTVCITNSGGLRLLEAGRAAPCLFNVVDTTHVSQFWRFPVKGPLYIVVVNPSIREPVRVSVDVANGLVVWGSYIKNAYPGWS